MAGYGRLEVFFPDGIHKTFILSEDNVSVGRQPGNVIPLETDTISRYHLTITHSGDQVIITDLDSANGTFIDGRRLDHDEQQRLIGGEEILIGELRLFYYNLDDSPTRPNTPVVEEVHPHVDAERATFSIEMDEPEIAVPPGAHTSAELRVINRGTKSERFTVEVTGVPKSWLRIDRSEFDLRTDEPVYVQISFKPVRQPASAPGSYPVTVTVRSRNDATRMLQCVITLVVLPYSGFGMALENRQLNPGQPFRLHLHNQGSADLPITVSGRDISRQLNLTLAPNRAVLKPDQRLIVNGSATPKTNRVFGSPKRYPFDLIVHSGDAAGYVIAQRAAVTQRPPLPGWSQYALIGLIALVFVTVIGALLLGGRTSAAPTISNFRLQQSEVLMGEPLQADWTAEDADSLVLSINSTPVSTLDGETISATIPTGGLEGTVLVSLQAINAGGDVRAEATALITPGLTIETFAASLCSAADHLRLERPRRGHGADARHRGSQRHAHRRRAAPGRHAQPQHLCHQPGTGNPDHAVRAGCQRPHRSAVAGAGRAGSHLHASERRQPLRGARSRRTGDQHRTRRNAGHRRCAQQR